MDRPQKRMFGVRILLTWTAKIPKDIPGKHANVWLRGKNVRAFEVRDTNAIFDYSDRNPAGDPARIFFTGGFLGDRFDVSFEPGEPLAIQNLRSGRMKEWNLKLCPECFAPAEIVGVENVHARKPSRTHLTFACALHRASIDVPSWSYAQWRWGLMCASRMRGV